MTSESKSSVVVRYYDDHEDYADEDDWQNELFIRSKSDAAALKLEDVYIYLASKASLLINAYNSESIEGGLLLL